MKTFYYANDSAVLKLGTQDLVGRVVRTQLQVIRFMIDALKCTLAITADHGQHTVRHVMRLFDNGVITVAGLRLHAAAGDAQGVGATPWLRL